MYTDCILWIIAYSSDSVIEGRPICQNRAGGDTPLSHTSENCLVNVTAVTEIVRVHYKIHFAYHNIGVGSRRGDQAASSTAVGRRADQRDLPQIATRERSFFRRATPHAARTAASVVRAPTSSQRNGAGPIATE